MKAKNILMICLFISGLFCLPSKAQQPGENVSSQTIRKLGEKHFFSISTIPDDIFRLMQGKTYKKNCTVARSELRYIRCLHVDKDGRNIVGEMVVSRAIAERRSASAAAMSPKPQEARLRSINAWACKCR